MGKPILVLFPVLFYNIVMKKKILPALIFIMLLLTPAVSRAEETAEAVSADNFSEEIKTPNQEEVSLQAVTLEENSQEKTLSEKLRDVYCLEAERIDKPTYLLEEILTKHYGEDSILEKTQLWAGYNGDIGFIFTDDGHSTNHYDINTINLGFDGYLKNNNADFRLMFNYNPFTERNVVQNLFADVYIATNKIPHHRLLIGNSRPPVGVEGGAGPFVLPFAARSQIARNFGTVRKLGTRLSGNYSLIDYDLGLYSSDTYFQEFFPGMEYIGWVNIKPFGKTDGRYGQLKIGGGIDAGNRNTDFCVTGANVSWEYKKFSANIEWAHASGYNGPAGYAIDKHASGFYTTLGYMLTKKLQLLARYDEFDPNREIANDKKREYSFGLNYFIKGQGLRLILNYVFCQNDNARDSHRIILGTQILI